MLGSKDAPLSQGRSDAGLPSQGFVDAKRDPGQQAILDPASELDVLHDWVANPGAVSEEIVVLVQGELDFVSLVGAGLFDLVDEVLVKVDHSDVRGRRAKNSPVRPLSGTGVYHDVDVSCAAGIVAWEECLEVGDTVMVGLLKPAQEGGVGVTRTQIIRRHA